MNIDEDDTRLFRPLEPGEFGIYTQSDELPVSDCPVYLMEGVGGICLSGTATVKVFSHRFRIVRGMVLALFPWQLISIKEVSDDFGIRFFRISHDMFTDTLSSLWRARPGFFFYMRTHIASEPREEYVGRFLNFCDLLAYRAENAPVICRRESVMQLLRVFYWDVYTIYLNDPQAEKTAYTHKEELAFRFMRTVVEEHSPNRDVAYFAERLGITPKYLTNLMNEISGQSARDWIVCFTIFEIKALLRESAMDLKTIVARVNFPDQSTLSRFFRRYTGMSPSRYRKNIHF